MNWEYEYIEYLAAEPIEEEVEDPRMGMSPKEYEEFEKQEADELKQEIESGLKVMIASRGHLLGDTERQVVCLHVYHGMSFSDIREIIRPGPHSSANSIYKMAVSKLTEATEG